VGSLRSAVLEGADWLMVWVLVSLAVVVLANRARIVWHMCIVRFWCLIVFREETLKRKVEVGCV
jgi:hypothetical protein